MKFIMRALQLSAVIVVLVFVGLIVVLLPPHMQVRKVHPALPEVSWLDALKSAQDGPVGIRYVNTSTQVRENGHLGHTVFLIEWADGRIFMVDTGMDREQAARFAALLARIGRGGEVDIHGTLPELVGDEINQITGAGFTHLHIDHTQGIVPFCDAHRTGATLYQTEFQRALHNFNTKEGAALAETSCLETGTLTGDASWLTTDAYPGLAVFPAGGHTPGSTIFILSVDGHLWILAGDITNNKADLLADKGKGFVYSYLLVPENTKRLGEVRRWLAELDARDDVTVIISHDIDDIRASGMAEF